MQSMRQIAGRTRAAVLALLFALAWGLPQALAQLSLPGSLIVAVTSPASGSTVTGTVPVSSSVSIVGSLVVAGVQFKLDGANLGAQDTTAPYSISWNTVTASNGQHILTAVAQDLLGNQYTSDPVTVTVFNDTTPPTVSITSPASAATVSGTITVTANASDNVGVAGVQFFVDGAALGAEDTTAPYSVAFDTIKVANGSHTLTARARDAAGNVATSAPVSVTVSNASTTTVKRFEETDSSVTLGAGWSEDASRAWSGGTAAVSTTAGAQATFSFTGPSVTWIGGRAPGTGIANVSLDGAFVAEVDTYSKTEEIRVPMFTLNGLTNASHTLTIEVTGQMNPAATSVLIVVDAFDVPAPAVSRLQETDPDITYTAGWAQGDASRAWSQGIAAVSTTAGAQATFTFTGTSITWIGARGPETGIASVSLDGVVTTVDTYSSTEQIQAAVFTATGLAGAPHTLTIEVTGQMNAASTSALVVVDAFEVTSPGTQIQETDPSISYGSGWVQGNRDRAYGQGTAAESNTPGSQSTFTFTGTGVSWIGARGPQTGIARVFLDGVFVEDIDTYSTTEGIQHTDFAVTGLTAGPHTMTIEVMGQNPASSNSWVLVDAFNVVP